MKGLFLAFLFVVAIIMAGGEAETTVTTVLIKLAGVALMAVCAYGFSKMELRE